MFNAVEQRKRQIDTLKIFNDNVSEKIENEEYEIKFKAGKKNFSLLIELDQDFPFNIPKLSLQPKIQHAWIENNYIKNFPGILNFTINSDLGRICQAIIREFEKNPPEILTEANERINSSMKEIEDLEIDQLQALLTDDQYFDDFIEELQSIKSLNTELDSLIENNEKLAIQNLNSEATLKKFHSSIGLLSIEFLNLAAQYNDKNKRYADKCQEYLPENIRQLLEIAVSNGENECEEIVESFLNGDQTINQFLENFMETKKLIAMRKFKEERLNFQLNQIK